ncbi:MAG: LytTR family DNA-binding domain-containing protein [Bacteroidota bacterium]
MIKAIIVEDEKHNRESLHNLLAEFCPTVAVIGMAASVGEGLALIRNQRPDLVFLDIELNAGTGFDLLSQLDGLEFDVIFTTAFEHYALRAIKFSSLDYLLKPIDLDELQRAVAKAGQKKSIAAQKAQLEILMANLNQVGNTTSSRICLSTSDSLEFVHTNDILFCEANGSYTNFHLKGNRKILVSKNLKEYEQLLDKDRFMRVHNRYLINLGEVQRYIKTDGGHILMSNGDDIAISPRKRKAFLEKMGMGD